MTAPADIVRLAFTPVEEGGYAQACPTPEQAGRFGEDFCDPDLEWVPFIASAVEGRSYRGHEGLRQWARDMSEGWEELVPRLERVEEDGDQVVSFCSWRGRGRQSGVEMGVRVRHLWTFRSGRVLRMEAEPIP